MFRARTDYRKKKTLPYALSYLRFIKDFTHLHKSAQIEESRMC